MMLGVVVALLMAPLCFAQTPRQPTSSEGKTTFTNIAVTGLNNDGSDGLVDPGTPGYIEMISTTGRTFYLYIDAGDMLRMSSGVGVGFSASPATIGWADGSGEIVGLQGD